MEKIQMKRRDFVKIVGLASGGLILGCNVSPEKIVINNGLIKKIATPSASGKAAKPRKNVIFANTTQKPLKR